MKILVTGGAGYIGSVCVNSLIEKNHQVIVVDNLSKGKKELVNKKAKFYQSDLTDKDSLKKIFSENKIDAIIHFASYKSVEESMENAQKYSDNILGTINLLNSIVEFKVKKIIFSSSAAVYGAQKNEIVSEDSEKNPINFYGFTKLECEKIIEWYGKIHKIKYNLLRYFNVVGDVLGYDDPDAKNLFPIILEVVNGKREKLLIFGKDYPTRDGTCVRDYIDIRDLVRAHILALNTDYDGPINLGTNKGYTTKEILDLFIKVYGKKINYDYANRRKGDCASLIASNKLAKEIIQWSPTIKLEDTIQSVITKDKLKKT